MTLPAGAYYNKLHLHIDVTESVPAGQAGTIGFSVIQQSYTDATNSNPGSISGVAFLDANADGSLQGSEAGAAGVSVALINTATNTVVATTTTDANGAYTFANLFAGSYQVAFVTPSGDIFSPIGTSASLPNSVVNDSGQTGTIVLAAGQNVVNEDAGIYVPASFTAHVYTDANANNVQDGSETNLAGVTVKLENASGTVLNTATTDANGNVSFGNLAPGSYQVVVATLGGDVVTQQTNLGTVNTLASGGTANAIEGVYAPPGAITVIKLPSKVVVGTCGQVSYTYNVTNTGTTPLTNVQISDNIGTAANPNTITPAAVTQCGYNVGDVNHNGVLDVGESWQFTNTINQAGSLTGGKSSQCQTISGSNLTSGCTAWLNSSFTPTSCQNGASYTFQNVTCTISGPGCTTTTIQVPNACVTFSNQCTTPTTTYDPTQNCWVTTLPAGCNPGNVFMSGLPFQVPSGCNLAGATITWNIGRSSNNCGAGSVSWQTGCSGYSGFGSACVSDLNQIGVKVCDNSASYGNWGCGSWSFGNLTYATGFGCAGTPGTQYSGWNWSGGTCSNGSGSGSVCQVGL
jgi:uncharacterized repeat protein (TIGR01451 family)